jgi:rhodanese-related sulfurtransferase
MGHLKGSVNIPLEELPSRLDAIESMGNRALIFYCRSGNRSGQAVGFLRQQGFENIYNGGGMEDVQHLLN